MATLTLGWIMRHFLNNNHLTVVLLGGACLILAAILMRQVPKEEPEVGGNDQERVRLESTDTTYGG
jgi:hypothetical protein